MRHVSATLLTVTVLLASAWAALARPELNELYSGSDLYRRLAQSEAIKNGIPFPVVDAVISVESAYKPQAAGDAGEVGLMQVLPSTAHMLGFRELPEHLSSPSTNIQYGTQYLANAWRLAKGDICTTVMKYRAGHGETRFSQKSVDYCVAVRKKLQTAGFPVTGKVPKATFGFGRATTRPSGSISVVQSASNRPADFSPFTDPKTTCSAIEISGPIEIGDYDRFAAVLKETSVIAPLRRVYLNTAGGSAFTAMAISKLIQNTASDVETIVPPGQMCDSVCLILLTGGSRRYVSSDATIILRHAFDKADNPDAHLTEEIGKYLNSNGMPVQTQRTFASLQPGVQLTITPFNAKLLGSGAFTYYGSTDPPATPHCSWGGFIAP